MPWATWCFGCQIHAVAKKEFNWGATVTDSNFRISDFPIAAFGSCAYLEEKALATVQSCLCFTNFYVFPCLACQLYFVFLMVDTICFAFQRMWYCNLLMTGFHLVVLLAAGPGIRDTRVIFWNIYIMIHAHGLYFNHSTDAQPNSLQLLFKYITPLLGLKDFTRIELNSFFFYQISYLE